VFKKWTRTTAIVESIVPQKRIALLAHDRRMNELVDWVERNFETLARHTLVCTRSMGRLVEEALYRSFSGLGGSVVLSPGVLLLRPRALGGHRELAELIAEGAIDLLIWFGDAVSPSALVRIARVRNIPIACNRPAADALISSARLETPRAAARSRHKAPEGDSPWRGPNRQAPLF